MSDPTVPYTVSKSIREVLLISAFAASVLVLVGIVVSALSFTMFYPNIPLPSHLKEWAGVSIGFLAGQLFKWVGDQVK